MRRELLVTGKDIRARAVHIRVQPLWLGTNNRPPMTANGIYQMVARRGEKCGVAVNPHEFRHYFSPTARPGRRLGDPGRTQRRTFTQMLRRAARAPQAKRARRTHDHAGRTDHDSDGPGHLPGARRCHLAREGWLK